MPLVSSQGCNPAVTSDNRGVGARHEVPRTRHMALSDRDSIAVQLVGTFYQATASQLREVVYHDVSRERLRQCLARLCTKSYLRRMSRRPAGEKGGSGAYVYQLGPAGWIECNRAGRYRALASVSEHELAKLDIFADVVKAERCGALELLPQPEGWRVEHQYGEARVDIAFTFGVQALGKMRYYCIEVETTNKSRTYISDKCARYTDEMMLRDKLGTGGILPFVLFAVPHHWMVTEIRRIIRGVDAEYRHMF